MENFEKAMMEFLKIQNERLEWNWLLGQEGYKKIQQNERLQKCLNN